jgi:hypothetical protein
MIIFGIAAGIILAFLFLFVVLPILIGVIAHGISEARADSRLLRYAEKHGIKPPAEEPPPPRTPDEIRLQNRLQVLFACILVGLVVFVYVIGFANPPPG